MSKPIHAIAFDAYGTPFDVYGMSELAESMFPGRSGALTALWRQKQGDYTRIRSLSGQYEPFREVTRDALAYAARALHLPLSDLQSQQLLMPVAAMAGGYVGASLTVICFVKTIL